MISLDNSELSPHTASQAQSYLTEMHKQLRLLDVDIKFLQVSRNSQTTQTRLASIQDRLKALRGYCLNILNQNQLIEN